ncbi:hypothetical protein PZ897_14480 [Hoeflea sp. YIM 152468]|uniref:hypothetical protein n=1 Tax=Hoeflea sp. YIM 152468 TaxID=3031759 RepID=UPI0023D990CB|nr:hypothetical protein [Hoeflea sp. YIM 152468]MDF1609388.1 hypothetical protein [Hoeflea sp. YIM 152468]
MTNSRTGPGKAKSEREETDHIPSQASLNSSVSHAQTGPEDAAPQDVRKEALRNTRQGDPFIVASDLEDSEQKEAAPGTREQD